MVTTLVTAAISAGVAAPRANASARARTEVVTSFYPLAWAAEAVGGKGVRVIDLTPAGAEPHDLELTTDDRDAIEDAGLVVVMGHDFQPAVEAAAGDRDGPTIEILDRIGISVDDASRDPHVWLDPALMQEIVRAVERGLSRADPSRAAGFGRRADSTVAELADLDEAYRTGLADCDRRLLVTAHEAFGWLATRYDLREQGVAGIDPDAEPDPRRLAELADLAQREGVTTVFTEELVSPKVARTLAREAGGLATRVLSPLESLSDSERSRGDDYVNVMRTNLDKLRQALVCR
jgi:zinc transport system substrate-binding protein